MGRLQLLLGKLANFMILVLEELSQLREAGLRVVPFTKCDCDTCNLASALGDLRVEIGSELLLKLIVFDG